MRSLLLYGTILSVLLFSSCEKLVEDTKKDLLLDIMTTGQWHVESYMEGANSITEQFDGYQFKFKDDGSVLGTKDLAVTQGTWAGDLTNYSIISNFPTAGDPLKKLNGTWKIKDSDLDYVAAEMKTTQFIILHLRKTP